MNPQVDGVLASIASKYELVRKLGQGGMGAVYLVRHRLLDQLRVVKVMHRDLGDAGDFEARFRHEAQVAAKLRHPSIATLHDFDVTPEGNAYIVMEYVRGTTLEAMLARGLPEVALAVRLALDTLAALDYLHHEGFVHRDISPDNLMVDTAQRGGPRGVLIDLGIAKRLGGERTRQLTEVGAFLGKVTYGSPEQFGTEEPSPRSDLYSLGVVLYQALTGRLPIESNTVPGMIGGHLYRPPLPFAESDPEGRVAEPLRRVLLCALEKDPAQRFASAGAMARALERAWQAALLGGDASELDLPTMALAPADLAGATPSTGALTVSLGPPTHGTPTAVEEARPTVVPPLAVPVGGPGDGVRPEVASPPPAVSGVGAAAIGPRAPRLRARIAVAGVLLVVAVLGLLWWRHGPGSDRLRLPPGFRTGPRYALVIGNNDYASRGHGVASLSTAVPDARAVASVLRERFGYQVDLRENATRDEMAEALYGLVTLSAEHDLLLFFAGHGEIDAQGRGYWWPVDAEPDNTANWIANREIQDALLDVRAKRVLVIADSCFSGTLGSRGERPQVDPATMFEAPARLVLTSGGEQPVEDRGPGEHSRFTRAFLDQLQSGEPLSSGMLFARLAPRLAGEQEPQWWELFGHGRGEFFFVPLAGERGGG